MDPEVGSVNPEINLIKVVFPQPLGPTTEINSPGFTDNEKSLITSSLPDLEVYSL